jgi:ribosomal protein S1
VFVTFFNNVTGLAGLSQLSNTFVDNPEKVYSVGQVIKCHVLTCDAQKKRISLSFLVSTSPHLQTCINQLALTPHNARTEKAKAGGSRTRGLQLERTQSGKRT